WVKPVIHLALVGIEVACGRRGGEGSWAFPIPVDFSDERAELAAHDLHVLLRHRLLRRALNESRSCPLDAPRASLAVELPGSNGGGHVGRFLSIHGAVLELDHRE